MKKCCIEGMKGRVMVQGTCTAEVTMVSVVEDWRRRRRETVECRIE